MIFFDIDGTLLDNGYAEKTAAIAFKNKTDAIRHYPDEQFAASWHTAAEAYINRYLTGELSFREQRRERIRTLVPSMESLSDGECDQLFQRYLEEYENRWRLFPDVLDCLSRLKGTRLGIISNGDSRQQRRKLQLLGIAGFFTSVTISGDIGIAKPDRGIFEVACGACGVQPGECVYVGDNYLLDYQASRKSGMNGVWLKRNLRNSTAAGPVIENLGELRRQLRA